MSRLGQNRSRLASILAVSTEASSRSAGRPAVFFFNRAVEQITLSHSTATLLDAPYLPYSSSFYRLLLLLLPLIFLLWMRVRTRIGRGGWIKFSVFGSRLCRSETPETNATTRLYVGMFVGVELTWILVVCECMIYRNVTKMRWKFRKFQGKKTRPMSETGIRSWVRSALHATVCPVCRTCSKRNIK